MKFLKHKTVNLFFVLLLTILLVANFFIVVPFYVFVVLVLIWIILTTIGSFNILWNYHVPSLNYRVKNYGDNSKNKQIALTFDDGPHPVYTPQVLDLLKQYNIKASFFCIGKNIEAQPELLKKIIAEGHLVANHTYSHSDFFGFYNVKKVVEELEKTNQIVKDLVDLDIKLFRPPFGVTNPSIKKGLLATEHTSIGWSVRSLDTVIKSKEKILNRITQKLKSGDIVLLHDISQQTVETLKDLLVFLERQQFEPVRVDELLEIDAYQVTSET